MRLGNIAGALVLTGFLSAANGAAAQDVIRIGVPTGLSGANSVVAPSVVQSAELAVEEINAAGGVLGKKLALEVADDGSGAAGAQKAADSLIFQKKVNALISMQTSAARNGMLPIVTRGKVPYIYTSLYEGRSCNHWLYADGAVPEQMVGPIVDHFLKSMGPRRSSSLAVTTRLAAACCPSPGNTSRRKAARLSVTSISRWMPPIGRPSSPRCDRPIRMRSSCRLQAAHRTSRCRSNSRPPASRHMSAISASMRRQPRAWRADADGIYISASYPDQRRHSGEQEVPRRHGEEVRLEAADPERPFGASVRRRVSVQGGNREGEIDRSPRPVIKALAEVSFDGPRGKVQMSDAAPCATVELTSRNDFCVLIIEHDLDFVREISSRVIVLHQGRILLDGVGARGRRVRPGALRLRGTIARGDGSVRQSGSVRHDRGSGAGNQGIEQRLRRNPW